MGPQTACVLRYMYSTGVETAPNTRAERPSRPQEPCETSTKHTHRQRSHTSGSLGRARPDVIPRSRPPLEDHTQAGRPGWRGRGSAYSCRVWRAAASRPGSGQVAPDRACWRRWTRRRRTRWHARAPACGALRSLASPCTTRRVRRTKRRTVAMALDPGRVSQGAEAAPRQCGGIKRAGHLRNQYPHLTAPLASASAYWPVCGAT